MSRYRGEIDTLRVRVAELQREVDRLAAENRIGPVGETQSAKTAYRMGRALRRAWRKIFRRRGDQTELEELRARAQVLERIVASASDEPLWAPPEPEAPEEWRELEAEVDAAEADPGKAEDSTAFRAGRKIRRLFTDD